MAVFQTGHQILSVKASHPSIINKNTKLHTANKGDRSTRTLPTFPKADDSAKFLQLPLSGGGKNSV